MQHSSNGPCSPQLEKSLRGSGDPAETKKAFREEGGVGGVGGASNATPYREASKKTGRASWVARGISPMTRGRGGARPQAAQLGRPGFCCRQGPPASAGKQCVTFTWFPTSLCEAVLMGISPFLVCSNMSLV